VNLSDPLDLDRAIKKEEERERVPARVPASFFQRGRAEVDLRRGSGGFRGGGRGRWGSSWLGESVDVNVGIDCVQGRWRGSAGGRCCVGEI
jgi:hypothetical protein